MLGKSLLGGFRKLDIPPIPLHKPHERTYAESEISIDPYPPKLGLKVSQYSPAQRYRQYDNCEP